MHTDSRLYPAPSSTFRTCTQLPEGWILAPPDVLLSTAEHMWEQGAASLCENKRCMCGAYVEKLRVEQGGLACLLPHSLYRLFSTFLKSVFTSLLSLQ